MNMEEQALCFMAGANSIFTGDKLLTTDNNKLEEDKRMFDILGLEPREAFKDAKEEHIPDKVQAAE
jgi:biotin synthase